MFAEANFSASNGKKHQLGSTERVGNNSFSFLEAYSYFELILFSW